MTIKRRYPQHPANARHTIGQRITLTFLIAVSACGACVSQDKPGEDSLAKDPEELLRRAGRQLIAQEFEEAFQLAAEAAALRLDSERVQQRAAEIIYLSGHAAESVPLFDRAVKLAPCNAPRNWQRGIALCTCGDFKRGAEQFKTHHDVNPDDVENSAWYFLCIAKTQNIEAARKTVIPSRGDGRQPMMSILKMLKGELTPDEVLEAAEQGNLSETERKSSKFYADLYVGLYYDALGEKALAAQALKRSLSYGISGYMVDTARVYLQDRLVDDNKADSTDTK